MKSTQPKIGELAKTALGFVAGIGVGLLQFVAAFIVAAIIMAFGVGQRSSLPLRAPLRRRAGAPNSPSLSTATIRAVAQGVSGWR